MSAPPSARDRAAVQGAHLARKVAHSVSSLRGGEGGLPADLLTPAAIETRLVGTTGFPDLADSVCYDPTQGLLAVGTRDGRVVLYGRPGVEVTLRSASLARSQHLCFLPGNAALLRVTADGDIQLFSVAQRRLLTSTWLHGDVINSVALLAGAAPDAPPYVLLGCESGNVRVVAVLDADRQPAAGASPAADLQLQPYQVLGQEVDGKGGVVAVAVAHLRPDRPLLLLVHRCSGALVWDIRAERILCLAIDEEDEPSKPTCACWVGGRANCFAVGYGDGSILLWGVPPAAIKGDPFKVVEPPDAQLLMTLRVARRGVQAAAVRSISFLAGNGGGGDGGGGGGDDHDGWSGEDCLLVFGGQGEGEPDMLTLMPLAAGAQGEAVEGGGRQIPWFGNISGFCMMPPEGTLPRGGGQASRAVMILTEGGQLVIHDLLQWQPQPLTLPVQELPPMTVSRLVPTVLPGQLADVGGSAAVSPRSPTSLGLPSPSPRGEPATCASAPSGSGAQLPQHALTLDKVRACSRRLGSVGGGPAPEPSLAEHWPFTGGEPAVSLAGNDSGTRRHPSALYFTGHRDGRVRVWDATTQVPELLLTVPAAAGQERLRSVTALEVCPFSGIVIVGHQGGDVRLYQFTESAQQVHRMNLDETLMPYENVGPQPGGFQYVLRYSAHAADVTAVSLATKLKLAAVADEAGTVSLLDLLQPSQLFSARAMAQPVAQMAFGSHVIPGPGKEDPGTERVVLFLAGADSSACMVGLDRGEPVGRAMRPKNASRPLAMALLDAAGCLLPQLHGGLVLHWANNNSAATQRSLAMTKVASIREPAEASGARLARLSLSERPSQSPLPAAGSRRSTGADSHRSWSRAESGTEAADAEREGSVEVRELSSDDDVDHHLAQAIQAVEEEKRAKAKFKLPAAFKRPSSRGQQLAAGGIAASGEADLPSPSSSTGGRGDSRSSFDPVGATGDVYSGGSAGPSSPTASAGGPSPDGRLGSSGVAVGAAQNRETLLSDADLVDYPYLIDGGPSPAAYLLLACADYLRLYDTNNVRLGDRSTLRKAAFEAPLCFAAAFMSVHGPGVVSVDASDALQVHSLPGLEQMCRKQLEDSRVLGFRWAVQPLASQGSGPGAAGAPSGSMCCSLDGQLIMSAATNEIARLAVVADCALPAAPGALYSARLAQAAAAAAAAAGARQGLGDPSPAAYPVRLEAEQQALQQQLAEQQQQTGEGGAGASFGRFFDQATTTMSGLASSAAGIALQELDRARLAGQSALQRMGVEGSSGRTLPPLQVLFATPVEPLEDIDYMPEIDEPAEAHSAAAAAAPVADAGGEPAAGAAKKLGSSLVSPREAAAKLKQLLPVGRKSERSELLDGAAAPGAATSGSGAAAARTPPATSGWAAAGKGGHAYNRSASEIKRTYGRGSKAGDVKGIMEQNQAMLAERGERLRKLDERTAEMQDDAEDFASLAKQLHDLQANRKWWQL